MLASMLDRHSEVRAFTGEDNFFEHLAGVTGILRALQAADEESLIERVIHELAFGVDPALSETERRLLLDTLRNHGDVQDSRVHYATGKAALADRVGASRWAQKAASYIFHVDAILETFPKARIVFLVRNPLDLAASMRRRGEWANVGRMLWGWNAGVKRALKRRSAHARNVRIFRYEDFVSSPEEEGRKVFSFCNLEFESECLDVVHVNRSEQPYVRDSESVGLNTSRVFYYPSILRSSEEMAVRVFVSSDMLSRLYPDLPDPPTKPSLFHVIKIIQITLSSVGTVVREHGQLFTEDPMYVLRRIQKRLSG